ncbi:HD domain-containing protein [bacterium]|nr:HD domain-containing protein [bacterium]
MFSTEDLYEIQSFSVGDTKAGTKMGKMQLKNLNTNTTLNCILWEETLNRLDSKVFRIGNQIKIVTASYNEKFNNCLVTSFSLIKEAKAGLTEEERETAFNNLVSRFTEIKDEKLRNFLLNYFKENEALIKVAPAAKAMHHNYIGGLLVHTTECLEYLDVNYPLFRHHINHDEAMAACIMHDMGKIFEYRYDEENGIIDYNEDFRRTWITHSQYGFALMMNNGFTNIARMIAAHHGRAEWGAIIDLNEKDLDNSLYLVHLVDNLSARFGKTSVSHLG